jgi:hypothetical protein
LICGGALLRDITNVPPTKSTPSPDRSMRNAAGCFHFHTSSPTPSASRAASAGSNRGAKKMMSWELWVLKASRFSAMIGQSVLAIRPSSSRLVGMVCHELISAPRPK